MRPLRAWDVVALGIDGGRLGLPVRNRRFHERVDESSTLLVRVRSLCNASVISRVVSNNGCCSHTPLVSEPALLLLDEPWRTMILPAHATSLSSWIGCVVAPLYRL